MTEAAHYQVASEIISDWRDDVLQGNPPVLYPIGTGDLTRIEIGPGRVTLLGGAPGAGKTAFSMQAVVDALRLTPELQALICNIEMPPSVLLDRQLARLSGIDLEAIRHRKLGAEHDERIRQGLATIESVTDRLCFVRPPFDLANVAACADDFGAQLVLLDYIQRIPPPGNYTDRRGSVNVSMDYLRQFADEGVAVLVVAAVGRTKDAKGRTSYDGAALNLASYRESSELEFGSDDAYIIVPDPNAEEQVILRHLKARHGRANDLTLHFHGDHQRFESLPSGLKVSGNNSLSATLASLWDRTPAANEENVEEGEEDK